VLLTAAGVVDQLDLFMQGKEKAILEEIEDTGQNTSIRIRKYLGLTFAQK